MEQVNNNNIEEKLSTLNSQLSTNIYPIFDRMMTREDKERLLKQRSVMVWFTGLSGSGKSTVAIALERELHKCGLLCRILDGDNIRSGINNNLGFSAEDRVENIRRIAEVSKLFIDTGVITIAAFISPNNDLREMAASIVGKENFWKYMSALRSKSASGAMSKGCMRRHAGARSRISRAFPLLSKHPNILT